MSLEHKIIWQQLNCNEVDKAIAFYGELFGWKTRPEERETYVHFYVGEQAVAGVMKQHDPPGTPPSWAVHVGTADIETLTRSAASAGGKLLTPVMDIPSTGKLCAMQDDQGGVLVAFQPTHSERDSWGHQNKEGHFCWVELITQGLDKSLEYYKEVVGWEADEMPMGESTYHMFAAPGSGPGQAIGGVMQMTDPEVRTSWLPYVFVKDVQACATRAAELGGIICVPPADIAEHGRIAVLIDPVGAVIGIYQAVS